MAPMMIKAILGEKYQEADESTYSKVKSAVNQLIDKTTGVQTLKQMKILAGLVAEFGFVPEDQILNEFGYKEIYNDALIEMVRKREEKLQKGELSIEDLVIKNATFFIKTLYDKGLNFILQAVLMRKMSGMKLLFWDMTPFLREEFMEQQVI